MPEPSPKKRRLTSTLVGVPLTQFRTAGWLFTMIYTKLCQFSVDLIRIMCVLIFGVF
jgi:hypothetical protein